MDDFFYRLKQLDDQPEDVKEMLSPVFLEALLSQIYLIGRTLKPAKFINEMPEKIMEVINYVNERLTEDLTLDGIASHFFISKNNLNSNFKKYLGTTMMEYIRHKKIIIAKQAIESGSSAMDAALQSGFTDYSSFYRSYVRYVGTSPRTNMTT